MKCNELGLLGFIREVVAAKLGGSVEAIGSRATMDWGGLFCLFFDQLFDRPELLSNPGAVTVHNIV